MLVHEISFAHFYHAFVVRFNFQITLLKFFLRYDVIANGECYCISSKTPLNCIPFHRKYHCDISRRISNCQAICDLIVFCLVLSYIYDNKASLFKNYIVLFQIVHEVFGLFQLIMKLSLVAYSIFVILILYGVL